MRRQVLLVLLGTLFLLQSAVGQAPLSPDERRARVQKAEQQAKEAFAQEHYVFVTPHGRVDPAEGGIPAFAVGLTRWTLYRGNRRISELEILRSLGRHQDVRLVKQRKLFGGAMAALGTGLGFFSAATTGLPEDGIDARYVAGGIGVFGGFALGSYGLAVYGRNTFAVDALFFDLQKANDKIRENLRAQYRLLQGVPLDPPAETIQPGTQSLPLEADPSSAGGLPPPATPTPIPPPASR